MKINIKTIPHKKHRYETVGDYWTDDKGVEQIRVSSLGDWRMELLVATHELMEDFLCQHRGIKEKAIMKFDIMFEKERAKGLWTDEEPGDDPRSPYRKEHRFATRIERRLAKELNVSWKEYDKIINEL